jgi:membrane protease YdiL (CAAX protease family)
MTPGFSTLLMGAVSIVWTIAVLSISTNTLGDSILGIGFAIAFYYGLTGFACAWYFRRGLFKSVRNFVYAGVIPFAGGVMLTYIFIKSYIDLHPADSGYSKAVAGIGAPVVIGIGSLLLGVVLMVFARFAYPAFFKRKPDVGDPKFLEPEAKLGEASVERD